MNLFEKNPTPLRAFREAEEKSARKKARAARWRRSWLRRAAGWLRDILRRPDRAQAGRTAAFPPTSEPQRCQDCGGVLPYVCATPLCDTRLSSPASHELLSQARLAALREQRPDLAAAVHSVLLLDLTGNLDDMATLVNAVQEAYQSALGDDPGAVN